MPVVEAPGATVVASLTAGVLQVKTDASAFEARASIWHGGTFPKSGGTVSVLVPDTTAPVTAKASSAVAANVVTLVVAGSLVIPNPPD